MFLSDDARRLLTVGPAHWNEELAARPPENASLLRDELESLATGAALLATYMEFRLGLQGCGAHDHTESAKAAIARYRKVRKALGFTYPNAGISSF